MDLKILVKRTELKHRANFYLIVQLDELLFPSKETKTSKHRTEVVPFSSGPIFRKNLFEFESLDLGSRVTLKLAAFVTKLSEGEFSLEELMVRLIQASYILGIGTSREALPFTGSAA